MDYSTVGWNRSSTRRHRLFDCILHLRKRCPGFYIRLGDLLSSPGQHCSIQMLCCHEEPNHPQYYICEHRWAKEEPGREHRYNTRLSTWTQVNTKDRDRESIYSCVVVGDVPTPPRRLHVTVQVIACSLHISTKPMETPEDGPQAPQATGIGIRGWCEVLCVRSHFMSSTTTGYESDHPTSRLGQPSISGTYWVQTNVWFCLGSVVENAPLLATDVQKGRQHLLST